MGAHVTTGSPSTRVSADLVRRCAACLRDVFALSPVRVTTPYEYMRLIMIGPHHRAHRHAQSGSRCHFSRARSTASARERTVLHELVLLNGHDCTCVRTCERARASVRVKACKVAAGKRECAGWGWHAFPQRISHPCMHHGHVMLPEQAEAWAAYGPRIAKPYASAHSRRSAAPHLAFAGNGAALRIS
jgi:hypothetical protein